MFILFAIFNDLTQMTVWGLVHGVQTNSIVNLLIFVISQ